MAKRRKQPAEDRPFAVSLLQVQCISIYQVQCDDCGDTASFSSDHRDQTEAARRFTDHGWRVLRGIEDLTYCPECAKDHIANANPDDERAKEKP